MCGRIGNVRLRQPRHGDLREKGQPLPSPHCPSLRESSSLKPYGSRSVHSLLFIRSLVHDIYSTTPTLPIAMTSEPSIVQRTLPTQSPSPAPASKPPPEPWLSQQVSSYFIAGGVAGAASRTVVSPLERLKIIQCAYPYYIYFRSLTAALADRFSLETRASSTRGCGEVLFVCGKRRVSRDLCEGMGLTAFGSYLTVPSNSRHMNNSRRYVLQ